MANAARFRGQLAGKEIAGGHAFEKQVLNQGEFKGLGIRTREQFVNHIENVVNNPTASRQLSGGRSAYWQDSTGIVVIKKPRAADGGTAFQPTNGRAYFDVACRAGTFIGGLDGSPPYDEINMIGLCTNASVATVRPGAERYPETFSVFVPGIEESAQGTLGAPPTAVLRAGSAVIEALTSTDGFAPGVGISGMGIAPGTTVLSVSTSARTAELSAPVSINAVDVEVRVASRRYITPARVTYSPTIVRNGPNVGA